jgi:hypothetical protein
MGTELNRTFSKEKIQMAKKIYEKMLTIPDHEGNANQNHTKILLEGLSSRTQMTTNAGKDAGKRNPHTLLVGI